MNILGLDLAKHTGFAVGHGDCEPEFGVHVLPDTREDVGLYLVKHEDWLVNFIATHKVEFVCYESPIIRGGKNPKTGKWELKTTITTLRKLYGLASETERLCHRLDLQCAEVPLQTIKKYLAGNGRADKPQMIAAARARGFDVKTDDEADALGIWLYTVNRFDRRDGTNFAQKWDLVLGQVA